MKPLSKTIGSIFKKLRNETGLSQEDVSMFLQIPRTAMTLIESGERELSITEFDYLCRIYRIAPNEILGWNRTKAKDQK